MRGIALKAGSHRVVLWFLPRTFLLGLAISVLAMLGCITACGRTARPRGTVP
jgi:hypothetical protein